MDLTIPGIRSTYRFLTRYRIKIKIELFHLVSNFAFVFDKRQQLNNPIIPLTAFDNNFSRSLDMRVTFLLLDEPVISPPGSNEYGC